MVYRVSAINLAIDLLRNNIWLIAINLLLLALSMLSIYFIRRQYIRPSENMAVELEAERALNQESSPACLPACWSTASPTIR